MYVTFACVETDYESDHEAEKVANRRTMNENSSEEEDSFSSEYCEEFEHHTEISEKGDYICNRHPCIGVML